MRPIGGFCPQLSAPTGVVTCKGRAIGAALFRVCHKGRSGGLLWNLIGGLVTSVTQQHRIIGVIIQV